MLLIECLTKKGRERHRVGGVERTAVGVHREPVRQGLRHNQVAAGPEDTPGVPHPATRQPQRAHLSHARVHERQHLLHEQGEGRERVRGAGHERARSEQQQSAQGRQLARR